MWQGTWKHVCDDGTELRQQSETERHPVNGAGQPENCQRCGKGWTCVAFQGPVRAGSKSKRPARRPGKFNAAQLELF